MMKTVTFKTAVLDSEAMIEEASFLLYLAYIEQEHWNFSYDNPSEIRVETRNGRNLLIDRFTDTARWFGVFDDEKLIGCARLHGLDDSGHYELEGYKNSEKVWKYLPRDNCREMGKVAVHPDYKGCRAHNLIYLSVFEYCQKNKYTVFGGLSNQYVKNLFQRVKLYPKLTDIFKYEETDPYPVNFYYVNHDDYQTIIPLLRATIDDNDQTTKPINTIDALEIIAPFLPIPTYWMDRDGVVLGANDLCLKGMGLTREKVIGKKPGEFYPEEVAKHILNHNEEVMRAGQMSAQEEIITNSITGKQVFAKAIKLPLYGCDNDKVIGIIGTSVDLTAEKEAEQLKIENERQKTSLEEQAKYVERCKQLAHDVASPITALQVLSRDFTKLQEDRWKTFQTSLERLFNMTHDYLSSYRSEGKGITSEPKVAVLLHDLVNRIVSEKKVQFENKAVTFTINWLNGSANLTLQIQPHEFMRGLSNLLNNAAEAALESGDGIVTIQVEYINNKLMIKITDNGKGMPEHVKEKILKGQRITEGKVNGNGLGLGQVMYMLAQNGGDIDINSVFDYGTTVILSFSI